jgi:hypothetical protein
VQATRKAFPLDNAPHHPHIDTYPAHFHYGDETSVQESNLSNIPEAALRQVLQFVRVHL